MPRKDKSKKRNIATRKFDKSGDWTSRLLKELSNNKESKGCKTK